VGPAAAVAHPLWARCRNKLDEAKELDPAGETEDRVGKLRKTIAAKLNPDTGPDKPPGPRFK